MKRTRKIAVIGSSGGGTATLGHTDARALLHSIDEELRLLDATIWHAYYVSLDNGKGLDGANECVDNATVYTVQNDIHEEATDQEETRFHCRAFYRGVLKDVNKFCRLDNTLSQSILAGEIDGLICISCHVGIFSSVLLAAASKEIRVTGSGGTSLSQVANLHHIRLIGNAGGSVATTTFTRAVSYTSAFAAYWKLAYEPWKRCRQSGSSCTSVLNSCLPMFWGVCLLKQCLLFLHERFFENSSQCGSFIEASILVLEQMALPFSCCVTMATSHASGPAPVSSLNMAALIASTSCSRSILSGLLAGRLVSFATERLLYTFIFWNIPATMASLLISGGVGALIALLMLPVSPVLGIITASIRWTLAVSVGFPNLQVRIGAGCALGCFCCYGSKVGWYHSVILPLILIEMELGDASVLGAVDELTLVLVSAGICAANVLYSTLHSRQDHLSTADIDLCRRGFFLNIACGDFVEACYPLMENRLAVNVSGYLASGLSTAWLVASSSQTPKSLAYLPLPIAIGVSETNWVQMAVAACIAFGISFFGTLIDNWSWHSHKRD
jgi:hypothetical protein